MTWSVPTAGVILIVGILALILAADKAVESSVRIARGLRLSPIITGLVLVSLGTDMPEIINSVTSAAQGHANVGFGDAIGSYLAQFTLVLGLLPLLGRSFHVERKEVLVTGVSAMLGLAFSISMAEKGYFTRENGIMLVLSWVGFVILVRSALIHEIPEQAPERHPHGSAFYFRQMVVLVISFATVGVASSAVVRSVLQLASHFAVSEYLVSFFVVAIGTSLPELVVDLAAIRKGHIELALGDIIGSCLVDATVSVGMGHVFFPQAVTSDLAMLTGTYAGVASLVVVAVLAIRQKLDKRAGLLFLALYMGSYLMLRP